MIKSLRNQILILLFFVILASIVFRCGWGADKVFSGSDANIGLIARSHRMMPEVLQGAYYAPTAVFGGASKAGVLTARGAGYWLLSPAVYSDTWYGFYLVLSSVFLIAYLRIWKLSWPACLFGAIAGFWVGSITLASSGHLAKLGVLMLFTLALFFVEKSVRSATHVRRVCWAVGAGVATGLMLLEQQDVALFAGLFLGVYTLFRLIQTSVKKPLAWVEILAPIAVIGLLMAASTAMKAYKTNVIDTGAKKDPQVQWDFITQWSMVPKELPDLIAPGYGGWSSNNPEGPYWGKVGQSPEWETSRQGFRNFRLDSLYLGVLPIALSLFGFCAAFKNRREEKEISAAIFCWGGLALLALLLSFGKYSFVYKAFYNLPLVGNIRAPIKFLHNFQVINAILAAYGLDRLMSKKSGFKPLVISVSAAAGLFILLALGNDTSRFAEWGEGAEVIARNIRGAWFHAAAMAALLAGILFLRWKRPLFLTITHCAVLLISAVALDSILLTRHYFKADNIATLKQGNAVINFLKENQGDERIYFLDQSGIYNRWLAVEVPYHGLQVFNIWQMPRMPAEYKQLFAAAGRNQPRLWQLAAIKYITAPASVLKQLPEELKNQLKPVLYYRFVRQGEGVTAVAINHPEHKNDQVLLENTARIPRFALYHHYTPLPSAQHAAALFAPSFDPLKTVLFDATVEEPEPRVDGPGFTQVRVKTTLYDATIQTDSLQPGMLLFNQRYQPLWSATIDGSPVDIMKCNFLCMGVFVPAGKHEVRFAVR